MKDINQTAKNTSPGDKDVYRPYRTNSYYYINSKGLYEGIYEYAQDTHHPLMMGERNEGYDKEEMKLIWKKERNRLAAKKSRDKKAIQIRELEYNNKRMKDEIRAFRECICDYDNVLAELFGYIEHILENSGNESRDDFILLFDCLCKLKRSGKQKCLYITEVSDLFERPLQVTNERINDLTCRIRDSLRMFLAKKKEPQK